MYRTNLGNTIYESEPNENDVIFEGCRVFLIFQYHPTIASDVAILQEYVFHEGGNSNSMKSEPVDWKPLCKRIFCRMLSIDVELQTMVLPEILGTNFNLTQHENYVKDNER